MCGVVCGVRLSDIGAHRRCSPIQNNMVMKREYTHQYHETKNQTRQACTYHQAQTLLGGVQVGKAIGKTIYNHGDRPRLQNAHRTEVVFNGVCSR